MNFPALAAGTLLLAAASLAWWRTGHVTHPVVVFCGVWGAALGWTWMTGPRYYPLSSLSIAVYLCGAVGFIWGAWFFRGLGGNLYPLTPSGDSGRQVSAVLLNVVTVLLLIGFPVFFDRLRSIVGSVSGIGFLYAARRMSVNGEVSAGMGPVLENLVPVAMIASLVAVAQPETGLWGRARVFLLCSLALAYSSASGSRGGALMLIPAWTVIGLVRAVRLRVGTVAGGIALVLLFFGGLGVLVRKGEARPELSLRHNAVAIAVNLQDYALSGVIAFDRSVRDPNAVTIVGDIERTAMLVANRLGASYEIPSRHPGFIPISENNITNVFSAYYTYYRAGGLLGATVLLIPVGALTAFAYRAARNGHLVGRVWHGLFSALLLLSIFSETFYSNVSFYSKLILFLVVVRATRSIAVTANPSAAPVPETE